MERRSQTLRMKKPRSRKLKPKRIKRKPVISQSSSSLSQLMKRMLCLSKLTEIVHGWWYEMYLVCIFFAGRTTRILKKSSSKDGERVLRESAGWCLGGAQCPDPQSKHCICGESSVFALLSPLWLATFSSSNVLGTSVAGLGARVSSILCREEEGWSQGWDRAHAKRRVPCGRE